MRSADFEAAEDGAEEDIGGKRQRKNKTARGVGVPTEDSYTPNRRQRKLEIETAVQISLDFRFVMMPNSDSYDSAAAQLHALRFQLDAGCDELLSPVPLHRFARPAAEHPAAPPSAPPAARRAARSAQSPPLVRAEPTRAPSVSRATRQTEAAALARAASTLDALRHTLEQFDGLPIKAQARTTVFADGNPQAPLMLIGEAPGRDEDLQGKPFVGESGQLLDKMLAACGWTRASDVYITNCLPWRPPGNRTPSPEELELMAPFVHRHIALVQPRLLVFLGGTAAQFLLQSPLRISRLRGQWQEYRPDPNEEMRIAAMPMFHPAWFLRRPEQKARAWQDWLKLRQRLNARPETSPEKSPDKSI